MLAGFSSTSFGTCAEGSYFRRLEWSVGMGVGVTIFGTPRLEKDLKRSSEI